MKIFRLHYRSADGWHHWVEHFKTRREALQAKEETLQDKDSEADVVLYEIDTKNASKFEVIQVLGFRSCEHLSMFFAHPEWDVTVLYQST